MNSSRAATLALASLVSLAALVGTAGCRREIGDDCQTSVDCDPNGTRTCDLSQPGGYCTILACDEKSCPEGATCIRYFPEQYLTKTCVAACEDIPPCDPACVTTDGMAMPAGCQACPSGCTGPTNDCSADELCLETGFCARRALEHRSCAKSCASGGDCRDGYECRPSNAMGTMVLATNPDATTNFCAPRTP